MAKIVDFGLAKLAGRTMLTKEGTTLGTVAYMSPEQTQGTEIDHRTDIWALGAVLYEMVTGRQPFEGDYEQAVQYSIMNEEPEPMTGLRTGVPMELEQIVNKALAKNPQERYQNVNEVAVDLNRIVKTLGTGKRTSPESRTQQPERARRFRLAATAIVIMVLIVAGFYLFSKGFLTKPDKSIDSIAVLPLDNLSRDPEQDYFVDGMHEALITNLSRISALKVISRTSVMRYQQTEKTMPEIARELGVDALVEGSVLRVGDQVRITAQLIHGSTDEHIWAANYDRDLSNVLTLLNEVAAAIATEIRIKLTSQEIARLGSAGAVNPEAHDAYLQGRYLLNRGTEESTGKAMAYFEQAIAADPDYAPAYAGRADAYLWLDDYDYLPELQAQEQAKAAAQKAIELNESLAEGYSALAHLGLHAWDWATTEGACRRGLELNPSYAMTHQWYAMYLSAFGRFDEAIAEARKAEALDPLSLSRINNVAMQLYHARRFDEAMVQVQRLLEMDPNYPRGLRVLGQIYSGKGMHREAIAQYGKYSSVSKGSTVALAFLGNAYGLAGDRERVLRALDELSTRSKTEYVSAFEMALVRSHPAPGRSGSGYQPMAG